MLCTHMVLETIGSFILRALKEISIFHWHSKILCEITEYIYSGTLVEFVKESDSRQYPQDNNRSLRLKYLYLIEKQDCLEQ